MNSKAIESRLASLWAKAGTWGEIEKLAGVADRAAFWKDKSIGQAREAMRQMIRERIKKGEL